MLRPSFLEAQVGMSPLSSFLYNMSRWTWVVLGLTYLTLPWQLSRTINKTSIPLWRSIIPIFSALCWIWQGLTHSVSSLPNSVLYPMYARVTSHLQCCCIFTPPIAHSLLLNSTTFACNLSPQYLQWMYDFGASSLHQLSNVSWQTRTIRLSRIIGQPKTSAIFHHSAPISVSLSMITERGKAYDVDWNGEIFEEIILCFVHVFMLSPRFMPQETIIGYLYVSVGVVNFDFIWNPDNIISDTRSWPQHKILWYWKSQRLWLLVFSFLSNPVSHSHSRFSHLAISKFLNCLPTYGVWAAIVFDSKPY